MILTETYKALHHRDDSPSFIDTPEDNTDIINHDAPMSPVILPLTTSSTAITTTAIDKQRPQPSHSPSSSLSLPGLTHANNLTTDQYSTESLSSNSEIIQKYNDLNRQVYHNLSSSAVKENDYQKKLYNGYYRYSTQDYLTRTNVPTYYQSPYTPSYYGYSDTYNPYHGYPLPTETKKYKDGYPRTRKSSKARERTRTHSVNDGFLKLRSLIPTDPPERKLSKIETLRLATSYIWHLNSVLLNDRANPTSSSLHNQNETVYVTCCRDTDRICTFCVSFLKSLRGEKQS